MNISNNNSISSLLELQKLGQTSLIQTSSEETNSSEIQDAVSADISSNEFRRSEIIYRECIGKF